MHSARSFPRLPDLGIGVGFRAPHHDAIFASPATDALAHVDWFEVISENYLAFGGPSARTLASLRARFPVIPHGVSLNLGGTSALRTDHLARLTRLVHELDAPWFSDHLCFTGTAQIEVHDLLPLPRTKEIAQWVSDRIRQVMDAVQRPFLLENPSTYLACAADEMPEWEFLMEIVERADCGILLDVNNVFVSAMNHGFDPRTYLRSVDGSRVGQIHLAGHIRVEEPGPEERSYLFDTHSQPVCDAVWELYGETISRVGAVTTLIEWDTDIPAFEVVAEEAKRAREVRDHALAGPKDRSQMLAQENLV